MSSQCNFVEHLSNFCAFSAILPAWYDFTQIQLFNIASKTKTYLGLYAQCQIYLPDFKRFRIFWKLSVKLLGMKFYGNPSSERDADRWEGHIKYVKFLAYVGDPWYRGIRKGPKTQQYDSQVSVTCPLTTFLQSQLQAGMQWRHKAWAETFLIVYVGHCLSEALVLW